MKTNLELATEENIDGYYDAQLRFVIELCRLFVSRLGAENGGELLATVSAMCDRAIWLRTDEKPLWPVLAFRVSDKECGEDKLQVPKYHGTLHDFVYPLVSLMTERPDLLTESNAELSRENFLKIKNLLNRGPKTKAGPGAAP